MPWAVASDSRLACDIRIAAEDARFSAMFTKRALTPDSGVSLLLPSAVRYPKAAEMILTSRFVDAREALKMGLVNRVVPDWIAWRTPPTAWRGSLPSPPPSRCA